MNLIYFFIYLHNSKGLYCFITPDECNYNTLRRWWLGIEESINHVTKTNECVYSGGESLETFITTIHIFKDSCFFFLKKKGLNFFCNFRRHKIYRKAKFSLAELKDANCIDCVVISSLSLPPAGIRRGDRWTKMDAGTRVRFLAMNFPVAELNAPLRLLWKYAQCLPPTFSGSLRSLSFLPSFLTIRERTGTLCCPLLDSWHLNNTRYWGHFQ